MIRNSQTNEIYFRIVQIKAGALDRSEFSWWTAISTDQESSKLKKALIVGISGQDGAYLAQFLLDKAYEVCGTSRDAQSRDFDNLTRLGILGRVEIRSMRANDFDPIPLVTQRPGMGSHWAIGQHTEFADICKPRVCPVTGYDNH